MHGEIRRSELSIIHYVSAACLDLLVNGSPIQEIFSRRVFATNPTSVRDADRLSVQSEDSEFRESQGSWMAWKILDSMFVKIRSRLSRESSRNEIYWAPWASSSAIASQLD